VDNKADKVGGVLVGKNPTLSEIPPQMSHVRFLHKHKKKKKKKKKKKEVQYRWEIISVINNEIPPLLLLPYLFD
jgi:hypothetical protein